VATQNITDPALGPLILARLAGTQSAEQALKATLEATPFAAYRQVLAIGPKGPPAVHSGARALGLAGTASGEHAAAAGNLLAHADVPAAMLAAFEAARGSLATRLLAGLAAGLARGGEAGPVHSAGVLVAHQVSWPIVDLRVDWSDHDPIAELQRLWVLYEPQVDAYVQRALDPSHAPGFAVPGDP
jgi:uncharacterized Ntn-hydrolase superfamily protein